MQAKDLLIPPKAITTTIKVNPLLTNLIARDLKTVIAEPTRRVIRDLDLHITHPPSDNRLVSRKPLSYLLASVKSLRDFHPRERFFHPAPGCLTLHDQHARAPHFRLDPTDHGSRVLSDRAVQGQTNVIAKNAIPIPSAFDG